MLPRLAITPGEPAGIGPDLCVMLAQHPPTQADLLVIADPALLSARATALGLPLAVETVNPDQLTATQPVPAVAGQLRVLPVSLNAPCESGRLDPANAGYVLATLNAAIDLCLAETCAGLVTGPVHKATINDAGIPFTGHTEYLADRCQVPLTVMMLATAGLRVALVTTHLPLKDVASAITRPRLHDIIVILERDLRQRFGIDRPRILVCGLNPHAGEGGHLGHEERDTIEPVLNDLRSQGLDLVGPLPADTLFTEKYLADADAVLSMYHDQGLPVLKYKGFGRACNITLGLPIIRTSVDHGTAVDLAGSGRADPGSLYEAIAAALLMAGPRDGNVGARG